MRSYRRFLALATLASVVGLSGFALPAHAEEACPLGITGTPMSVAQVKQSLLGQGYVTVRGLHRTGGCYTGFAIDKAGRHGEVMVDATSGHVLAAQSGGR